MLYKIKLLKQMSIDKICGCKGVRKCLLCEKLNDDLVNQHKSEEVKYVFTYCPGCNLCWPDNEETAKMCHFPLYIGKIKLHPDFFSEEEETLAVSAIDRIPWMPSQSGRRKQDFGPKVNFKKKRVKIGEFKGFPSFAEDALHKFEDLPELFNFRPVELCNLEYSPDRGSSIDPHVDDFWLWGERLVTINLGSSTVLTLVPCSESACECFQEATHDFQFQNFCSEHFDTNFSEHMFCDISTINSLEIPPSTDKNNTISTINCNNYLKNSQSDINNSVSDTIEGKSSLQSDILMNSITSTSDSSPVIKINPRTCILNTKNYKSNISKEKCSLPSAKLVENNISVSIESPSDQLNPKTYSLNNRNSFCPVNTMCHAFRNNPDKLKVAVRVSLPPRSLFVLAGCARYNWFHEIKRQDVVSRRLAMTFRELAAEFLDGGKENKLGKDLLEIASSFYD